MSEPLAFSIAINGSECIFVIKKTGMDHVSWKFVDYIDQYFYISIILHILFW